MSRTLIAQLVLALKSDVAAGASKDAAALKALQGAMQGTAKASKDMATAAGKIPDWGKGFTKQAVAAGATSTKLDELKKSWAQLHAGIAKGDASVGTARILWKNEAISNLAAVRAAQKQIEDESLKSSKQRMASEKRMLADMERDKLRAAREDLKQKQAFERIAEKAEKDAARQKTAQARDTAREQTRINRDEARQAVATARDTAREQVRVVRQSQREALSAEREAVRERRRALGIGGSIVSNVGHVVGLAGGAYAGAHLARKGIGAISKERREEVLQGMQGLTTQQIAQVRSRAFELSAKYPSVPTVNIQRYASSGTAVMGSYEHALDALETMTKARAVLGAVVGTERADHDMERLSKTIEQLHQAGDDKSFGKVTEALVKSTQMFREQFKIDDMLSFAQTAKNTVGGNSQRYLASIVPSMVTENRSGGTFGTQQQVALQNVIGGNRKGWANKALRKDGLLEKGSMRMINWDLALSDPDIYANTILAAAAKKGGVNVDLAKSRESTPAREEARRGLNAYLASHFSHGGERNFWASMIEDEYRYKANSDRFNGPDGPRGLAAADDAMKDPTQAAAGFSNAVGSLATVLGGPLMDAAIPKVNALTLGIARLASSLESNPEVNKLVGYGAGAVAATGGMTLAGWLASKLAGNGTGIMSNALRMGGGVAGGIGRFLLGPLGLGLAGAGIVGSNIRTDSIPFEEHSKLIRERAQRMDGAMQPNALPMTPKMRAAIAAAPSGVDGPLSAPLPFVDVPLPPMRSAEASAQAAAAGQDSGQAFTSSLSQRIAAGGAEALAQAGSIFGSLKSIFGSGIDVPIRPQVQGATPTGGATPSAPARASGGNVYAGSIYRVNEFGDEYFEPAETGRILNASQMAGRQESQRPALAPQFTIAPQITVNGATDIGHAVETVTREIERKISRAIAGLYADYGVDIT